MSVVAVVGLGYVGLPLAVEFGKKTKTIGFDLSQAKIESYRKFIDPTGEVTGADLRAATQLTATSDPAALAGSLMPISSSSPCPRPSTRRTSRT
jgi:UDP-N-acetyl-D-glucosamine/UDP-N-acetyl-D-galactosamine dehydrogenase